MHGYYSFFGTANGFFFRSTSSFDTHSAHFGGALSTALYTPATIDTYNAMTRPPYRTLGCATLGNTDYCKRRALLQLLPTPSPPTGPNFLSLPPISMPPHYHLSPFSTPPPGPRFVLQSHLSTPPQQDLILRYRGGDPDTDKSRRAAARYVGLGIPDQAPLSVGAEGMAGKYAQVRACVN